MRPEEVEKLLAGYATGTLDEAERRALMKAALERQELFDALVEEEALRELLADPRCRRRLLELLGAPRESAWRRAVRWAQRPAGVAALASATAAVVLVSALVVHLARRGPAEPAAPHRVEAPPVPAQAPAPAPAPLDARAASKPRTEKATRAARPAPPRADIPAAAPTAVAPVPSRSEAPALEAAFRARDEAAAAPALRYRVLRNGVEAPAGEVFDMHDSLVLRVEAAQPGLLSLYRLRGESSLERLFPPPGESGRVTPAAPLDIPLPAREQPGDETLVLALAPEIPAEVYASALRESREKTRAAAMTAPAAISKLEITLRFR